MIDPQITLTEHFTLNELAHSDTAAAHGFENWPDAKALDNLQYLTTNVLQAIRDDLETPIKVTSGFRSKKLNKLIGGSRKSQHIKGQAADIVSLSEDITNKDIADYIKDNLEFDQLIYEFPKNGIPKWVHVSYNHNANRKQVLMAFKNNNGVTEYKSIA